MIGIHDDLVDWIIVGTVMHNIDRDDDENIKAELLHLRSEISTGPLTNDQVEEVLGSFVPSTDEPEWPWWLHVVEVTNEWLLGMGLDQLWISVNRAALWSLNAARALEDEVSRWPAGDSTDGEAVSALNKWLADCLALDELENDYAKELPSFSDRCVSMTDALGAALIFAIQIVTEAWSNLRTSAIMAMYELRPLDEESF